MLAKGVNPVFNISIDVATNAIIKMIDTSFFVIGSPNRAINLLKYYVLIIITTKFGVLVQF